MDSNSAAAVMTVRWLLFHSRHRVKTQEIKSTVGYESVKDSAAGGNDFFFWGQIYFCGFPTVAVPWLPPLPRSSHLFWHGHSITASRLMSCLSPSNHWFQPLIPQHRLITSEAEDGLLHWAHLCCFCDAFSVCVGVHSGPNLLEFRS